MTLLLASSSSTRLGILRAAGLDPAVQRARIDEAAMRQAFAAEGVTPRDIADHLADAKARKVGSAHPEAVVIGCDQILDLDGATFGKCATPAEARERLLHLRGHAHRLHSAVVVFEGGRPAWRHVEAATLTMKDFGDDWLDGYLERNWQDARHSVGCYLVEAEGIRLFSKVEGDWFTILGLPLLPLLLYLEARGIVPK